ncbi:hypothetical protein ACOI1H_20195 [Loktanella sp. DJP18]|uniref:hypothetical protein n=1 Tax=Loktanella sp. DJP18 TaxID=3409788 RepID=UPI003BB59376
MADTTLTPEIQANILEAAKAVRALGKRSIDLTPADVVFLCIDPVLTALGWNTRDPRQVRRQDGDKVYLEEGGKSLLVHALSMSTDIPASYDVASDAPSWVVVTNGMTWSVFHSAHPEAAFMTGSLETVPVARSAFPMLSLFRKGALKSGELNAAWSAESIDDEVTAALKAHLAGSDALVSAIQSSIAGKEAGAEAVKAAIARLTVSINGDAVASTQSSTATAGQETAPAGAPAAKQKAATKVGKVKPAKAKSTKAKPAKAASAQKAADAPKAEKAVPASSKPATAEMSVEDPGWPEDATHVMRRKRTIAYIKYDKKSQTSVLLPGSIVTAAIGKSLNPPQLEAREQAAKNGNLAPVGDMLRVMEPMEFENPRLAATFAAATLVKDITVWTAKNGRAIGGSKPASATKAAPATQPETETPAPGQTDPAAETPAETQAPDDQSQDTENSNQLPADLPDELMPANAQ